MTVRRAIITATCLALYAAFARAVPFESRHIVPFFNMSMSQGAYLPSEGDFFTGANMGASLGFMGRITDNHSLIGLYRLGFSGQGFRFPDTQEFASKELSHRFNLNYVWGLPWGVSLRPGVSYGTNFSRTATGEIWGEGLYDNKTKSVSFAVDHEAELLGRGLKTSLLWQRYDVEFPNYTDIIREFQNSSSNTELAGGLKDQAMSEYALSLQWGVLFAGARYSAVDFDKEKVVESNGVYGATAQADSNLSFNAGFSGRLWRFSVMPEVRQLRHGSNQNFLLFKSVTDPSPTFAANYYDYTQSTLSVPLYFDLTKTWALSAGLDLQQRSYDARAPRDADNNFINGAKQKDRMAATSAGLRKKLNDVSFMTITYGLTVVTSNNHFERYMPSNYSGHSVALGYHLNY